MERRRQEPGWLAVGVDADAIRVAQVVPAQGKARAGQWGVIGSREGTRELSLAKAVKEHGLGGCACTTLLGANDYQILLVDAPSVPPEELKAAIRWKIKDHLAYHVDDATVDVVEVPADPSAGGKARSMYAVAAPNEIVKQRIAAFEDARLQLKVIDIPEMAQRNVAAYFEQAGRTTAMLSFGEWGGLLTFSYGGELLVGRRLDVSSAQLAAPEQRHQHFERVTAELRRSFDHIERQFHRFPLGELLLAPLAVDVGLAEHLAAQLEVSVRDVSLNEVIEFPAGTGVERAEEAEFFHLFGAALRVESKAL